MWRWSSFCWTHQIRFNKFEYQHQTRSGNSRWSSICRCQKGVVKRKTIDWNILMSDNRDSVCLKHIIWLSRNCTKAVQPKISRTRKSTQLRLKLHLELPNLEHLLISAHFFKFIVNIDIFISDYRPHQRSKVCIRMNHDAASLRIAN